MLLSVTLLAYCITKLVCLRIKTYTFTKMLAKLFVEDEDVKRVVESKLNTSEYELLQSDLQQPDTKIGLFGDHAFLKVKVCVPPESEIRELNFFVKYYPHDEISDEFAKESGAFRKETVINTNIFEAFSSVQDNLIFRCVPQCHLQKEDVLFFEDLTQDGFKVLDMTTTCGLDELMVILETLARFHACSLIYEEKKSYVLDEQYRLYDEYEDALQEAFYNKETPMSYAGAKATFKAIQTEIQYFEFPQDLPSGRSFKAVAEKYCNEIFDLVKPSKKYRNVICHGDLWFSNIFLKYSSGGVVMDSKFVDFQLYRYVPPAHDVMAVLFLNSNEEFRTKYLYTLIGLYYNALERHLKLAGFSLSKIIPFNDFLDSCEEQKTFAIVQSALYAQLIYLDSGVLTDFFANEELCKYAMHEDKSVLVLANINKNAYYREKLKDTIQTLWNYCKWI